MAETDLIRRSEVVEAIDNIDWYHQNDNGDMVSGASNEHQAWYKADDVYSALESVPSAQPEIIRCKDCKHWTNNIGDSELRDNYCNEAAHGFYYRCSGDDFCSMAGRRSNE